MIVYSNNGYLQKSKGKLVGEIIIDDINLSPIEALFFINEKNGKHYLWVKRQPILEYNEKQRKYVTREREPQWQVYMERQYRNNAIPFAGEFTFLHFKYKIEGTWDLTDLGKSKQRINLYVERLPNKNQTIINEISRRKNERG